MVSHTPQDQGQQQATQYQEQYHYHDDGQVKEYLGEHIVYQHEVEHDYHPKYSAQDLAEQDAAVHGLQDWVEEDVKPTAQKDENPTAQRAVKRKRGKYNKNKPKVVIEPKTDRKWSDAATLQFVTERLAMEPEFLKGDVRKLTLYKQLSINLQAAGHFGISTMDCISKFKCLMQRYRRNYQRSQVIGEHGESFVPKWGLYSKMFEVYGGRATAESHQEVIVETIDQTGRSVGLANTPNEATTDIPRAPTMDKHEQFVQYIEKKMKRDDEQERRVQFYLQKQTRIAENRNRLLEKSIAERNELIQRGIEQRNMLLREQNDILKRLLSKI